MTASANQDTSFTPFFPLATPGSIVWTAFHQLAGVPSKYRPALVIANDPESHAVILAYGTSSTKKVFPGEFIIPKSDPDWAMTGLEVDTKFDLGNTVQLHYTSQWFARAPAPKTKIPQPTNPVMGNLTPQAYKDVAVASTQIKK
ncbi:type II toxin-antitoxin system PemK/MazF family toxin [Citrobacter braakii]|uniref:type II toxin-antitoxin system PemK/MazF family toxin n=1 Tax=Citrobacter braakii TaxID=57706 RepID=UPI0024334137|nr:type II toxin-antitoxin system PemK/MazF family toxin [Citrobacter braakii]EMC3653701.1 type II toxin-antitoxin system PemK/MazF family toxin [Citrobacter braakii]WFV83297.1 type II toxin-antitoxin system PemK/MazF family toxin [Citrobacter braakii]